MTAQILDGRATAQMIAEEVRTAVAALRDAGRPPPTIAVVRVGEDPASVRYAARIERTFVGAGLGTQSVALPDTTGDAELVARLAALGADPGVAAILLQYPLPPHVSRERAVAAIDPRKDVDGVSPLNLGRLFAGRGRFLAPATPLGGIELLDRYGLDVAGKHAVVVGRSEIVGRPLAMLLLARHATVTICHSRTPDLGRFTRQADVLAVATGRPGLIRGDMVVPGAVVLDFGINVVEGQVVGDVEFSSVAPVAGWITPVPGGTGPMTTAMLLRNTLDASRWQLGI